MSSFVRGSFLMFEFDKTLIFFPAPIYQIFDGMNLDLHKYTFFKGLSGLLCTQCTVVNLSFLWIAQSFNQGNNILVYYVQHINSLF